MTPEQEALREKVAREIYDILEGPIADQDFGRQTRQWELSLVLADAAIAVVLKEASRVAAGCRGTNRFDLNGNMIDYTPSDGGRISRMILSLIPQEEGE